MTWHENPDRVMYSARSKYLRDFLSAAFSVMVSKQLDDQLNKVADLVNFISHHQIRFQIRYKERWSLIRVIWQVHNYLVLLLNSLACQKF